MGRAAIILALADDIVERSRPGKPIKLSCRVHDRDVTVHVPTLIAWRPRTISERFQHVFGRHLIVKPGR